MFKNYYDVLAVGKDASQTQIRERFLQLARQRHPDRFHNEEKARAETEFQAITEAFNVLSNPQRRRQHDLELTQPMMETRAVDVTQLARVYLHRGIKAYREGNFLAAAESFDRATKEDPRNAQAWLYLAQACSRQPRWILRATRAIAKACELEPMNVEFHKLAGRLFMEAQMPLRAERHFQNALRWGDSQDAEVLGAMAGLKKRKGA